MCLHYSIFNEKTRPSRSSFIHKIWCAERDLNPHDRNGQEILSLSCLPIPPSALNFKYGGTYGSRTHLKGFADLHVTVPSTRRLGYYNRSNVGLCKILVI